MPVHKEGSGYQAGHSGKVYHGKGAHEKANKQEAAIHASAHDELPTTAGVLFVCGDHILLMKRSDDSPTAPGLWSLPAGHLEEGESPTGAAVREVQEETGRLLSFDEESSLGTLARQDDFQPYVLVVDAPFVPHLNHEHSDADWFQLDDLPEPMHPGMDEILSQLDTNRATADRKPFLFTDEHDEATGRARFYTIVKLSKNIEETPEGFMLCRDVPIARTGMMLYGPDEVPIEPGQDGLVKIFRDEDEVFAPTTIASANGKSVTIDHPPEDVVPEQWKELTNGVVLNPSRGLKAMDDLLLADLLITTPDGIQAVKGGQREVSCGYDADYEQTAPGVGRQRNIIINHVALVEQGRCGPRCAIQDAKPKGETTMATGLIARLRRAKFSDEEIKEILGKDEAPEELATKDDEGKGGDIHIHLDAGGEGAPAHEGGDFGAEDEEALGSEEAGRQAWTDEDLTNFEQQNAAEHDEMRNRISALEAMIDQLVGGEAKEEAGEAGGEDDEIEGERAATDEGSEEAKSEDEDLEDLVVDEAPEGVEEAEVKKTADSRYMVDSFRTAVSDAEILVPGVSIPSFDHAASPQKTVKTICAFRRKVLDRAWQEPSRREVITRLLAGRTLDTKRMSCGAIRTLFGAAATMVRDSNNSKGSRSSMVRDGESEHKSGVTSLADLNRQHAEHYSK